MKIDSNHRKITIKIVKMILVLTPEHVAAHDRTSRGTHSVF